MSLISFKQWLIHKESSSHTRARTAAALGLMPLATVGSLHGRSTAHPWEAKQITKKSKKSKKKSKPVVKNNQVDSWLKEVGALKDDIDKLKKVFKDKSVSKTKKKDTDFDSKSKNKNPKKDKEPDESKDEIKPEEESNIE